MSGISKEGMIRWIYGEQLFLDKDAAKKFKAHFDEDGPIARVRVTPEPEPERFYVDTHEIPIRVRDRNGEEGLAAKFWNPLGSIVSIIERAEIHAAWLNEEAKKHD